MTPHSSGLEDRIYEAARLRGLAFFNSYDNEYTRLKRQEIRYYIDPAVALLLFIWPGRLQTDAEAANKSYLATFSEVDERKQVIDAVLSGECLFLPTLLSRAARDLKPLEHRLMLPAHWEEFATRLLEFMQTEVGTDADQVATEFSEAVQAALNISKSQLSADGAVGETELSEAEARKRSAALCEVLAMIENTKIMELAMLRRMRHRSLVRPATGLPQSIFHTDKDAVDAWSDRLSAAGKTRSIRPDAIVLAQLDALNAYELKKPPGQPRVKHVLVTGDSHIHHAFFRHRLEKAEKTSIYEWDHETIIPDFDEHVNSYFMRDYYLRHPAQFVPTLNQRELDNEIESTKLFDDIVHTTESFLVSVTKSEALALHLSFRAVLGDRHVRNEVSDHLKPVFHVARSEMTKAAEEVLRQWDDFMGQTILVNQSTLMSRIRASRTLYDEARSSVSGFQHSLEKMQNDLVTGVKEMGVYISARMAIAQVRGRLRFMSDAERRERRIAVNLLTDFSILIGDRRIRTISEAHEKNDNAVFRDIDERMERLAPEDAWLALLFSAVLAARASDWDQLIWVGGRALDALSQHPEPPEEYYEAMYVVALGHRMNLHDSDYEAANELLGRAIDHHQKAIKETEDDDRRRRQRLRLGRALSERGTLRLLEQFRRYRKRGNGEDTPILSVEDMRDAHDGIDNALEILEDIGPLPTETRVQQREARLAIHIQRQGTLNRPFFSLLGHFVYLEADAFPDDFNVERFVKEVDAAETAWLALLENVDANREGGVADAVSDGSMRDTHVDPLDMPLVIRFDLLVLAFARDRATGKQDGIEVDEHRLQEIEEYRKKIGDSIATVNDKELADAVCAWVRQAVEDMRHSLGA